MPAVASRLSTTLKRRLLTTILESRHGDLREENLNRQGKGHFHVSGRGHEALAATGLQLQPDDYIVPYYRDRGLVLGRGVTTKQLALDYMAKRESSSGGRQMPSHYSYRELNIWSVPTPTAAQLLPACGMAWGMQLDGKKSLVVTSVGDAATRQGDFYEAVCFAQERKLPVLFLVEDNGFGISTPTRQTTPRALGVLNAEQWRVLDGWDVEAVHTATETALAEIRAGGGPVLLWLKLERLSSHTSSDDQAIYRSKEELATLGERDPLLLLKTQLIADGELTEAEYETLDKEIKERVRLDYAAAELAENPVANELEMNVSSQPAQLDEQVLRPGKYRMGDVINLTLRAGYRRSQGRGVPADAETFDGFPGAGVQLAAGGEHDPRRGVRPRELRQAAGLRAAVHRLHLSGLEPARDQPRHAALAHVRQMVVSGGDLRAVRRLPAGRLALALAGERGGDRTFSRAEGRHSEHAGGCGRAALDGDALGGSGDLPRAETHALG